ncbi:MAG: M28 family peptidase [Bacteroidales bacterium]
MADELLSSSGKTIEEIENGLNEKREPGSFNTGTFLDATSEINQEMITTRNVIMKLEGNDPALAGEYVIVGGHYDHLGMGDRQAGFLTPWLFTTVPTIMLQVWLQCLK